MTIPHHTTLNTGHMAAVYCCCLLLYQALLLYRKNIHVSWGRTARVINTPTPLHSPAQTARCPRLDARHGCRRCASLYPIAMPARLRHCRPPPWSKQNCRSARSVRARTGARRRVLFPFLKKAGGSTAALSHVPSPTAHVTCKTQPQAPTTFTHVRARTHAS